MSRHPEYLNLRQFGSRWVNRPAVIKAADLVPLQRAAGLLASANEEAQNILRAAKDEYETQKQKGYADGHKEASDILLDALLKENQLFLSRLPEMQKLMSDVVIKSIKKIVADFDDYEKVSAVVLASLQKMRGAQSIRIHLAPEQIQHTEKLISLLRERYSKLESIEVVAETGLSGTRAIIETPLGRLDTSFDIEASQMFDTQNSENLE